MAERVEYTPPPSIAGFLTCDKFISLAVGPVGSTKTTAALMKIPYHASQMAKCRDGIRRSRAIVIRNTREQLRDTTIPDFLGWFPDGVAGYMLKSEGKFVLKFSDVECEVLFRGLDDTNDVKRLLSLQTSFGVMDEFREINPNIFDALQGRLGRYPSKRDNGVGCVTDDGRSNAHLWGATNPPDFDTWWEQYLTNPPENCQPFFQPSGMSPEADWLQYLPEGYYDNLIQGKTEEWIDVYVHAKFGKSLSGRPVFPSFKPDYHVAKGPLRPIKTQLRPLIIGMDFGLNPSACINQVDLQGRLLTFDCMTSDGMGVLQFIHKKLKPTLLDPIYQGIPVIIVGDPAGSQRAQTDARSVFDILRQEGFRVLPAATNAVVARINAVDKYLARQVDGGPGWLLDPVRAKIIITALRGGYRYKINLKGEVAVTPEKNEYSHPMDGQQYACVYADGGNAMAGGMMSGRRDVKVANATGWT